MSEIRRRSAGSNKGSAAAEVLVLAALGGIAFGWLGLAVVPTSGPRATLAAGGAHSVALTADGGAWAWGENGSGQLGDATRLPRPLPVRVQVQGEFVAVAAGRVHTLALEKDRTLRAWGSSSHGQLGNGTRVDALTPIRVLGLAGVVAIACGDDHSLALTANGDVWSWGDDGLGQIGGQTGAGRLRPIRIEGLSAVRAIAGGGRHSLALTRDGRVFAWGSNASGQIGDRAAGMSLEPAEVSGLERIVAVAAGASHSLALGEDGRVFAWGSNAHGQLGDAWRMESFVPLPVTVLEGVTAIAAGEGHSLAVDGTGRVWAWGDNRMGQLGSSEDAESATPLAVDGLPAIRAVAAGGVRSLARGRDGSIWEWGGPPEARRPRRVLPGTQRPPADERQQGSSLHGPSAARRGGPSQISEAPTQVSMPTFSPIGGSYMAVQTVTVSCATAGATIHYTTNGVEPTTADASMASGGTVQVNRSLTLKAIGVKEGDTQSATASATYTLSLGTAATPTFTPPPGTYTGTQQVSLASATSGATFRYTLDGTDPSFTSPIYTSPILVDDSVTIKAKAFKADMTPSATATGGYTLSSVAVATPTLTPGTGRYTTAQTVTVSCATAGATIRYRTDGLDPTASDPIIASGSTVTVDHAMRLKAKAWLLGTPESRVRTADYWITGAVATAGNFSLALKANGEVWAWGDNSQGQLGIGLGTTQSTVPVRTGTLVDIVAIAATFKGGLAVKRDGTVYSWGYGNPTPEQAGGTLSDVVAVATNYDGFNGGRIAVKADGTVWTWTTGQATQVAGLTGVTAVAAGATHYMVLKTDGESSGVVWRWGISNLYGQIGNGTNTYDGIGSPAAGLAGVTAIGAGQFFSLAVKSDRTLWGWGDNSVGELGDATTTQRWAPVQAAIVQDAASVAGGGYHTLALSTTPLIWSTGADSYGQLGDGYTAMRTTFGRLSSPSGMVGIGAGSYHSVALRQDGTVWAWGNNGAGQLGLGGADTLPHPRPVQVPSFLVADSSWLDGDLDGDGLSNGKELLLGSDPANPDTNGDGILDGAAYAAGLSLTNPDMDGDGVSNLIERAKGTDPFRADTDGDGSADGVDCFPLDPTRWLCPPFDPNDHTPPAITLTEPIDAVLIGSTP